MTWSSLAALRAAIADLPAAHTECAAAVRLRQAQLTKPPGSLGRLETLVEWLAAWQGRTTPRLDHVAVVVFAGNHGVTRQGVSAFPAAVTAQMVQNFAQGGAAINQLARLGGATLSVTPLDLDQPTADFTEEPALDEHAFCAAVQAGAAAVPEKCNLLAVGEMGIGNTTAAALLAAMLFGGSGADWVGRGTGVDDAGLARKTAVLDAAMARHAGLRGDPIAVAAACGGRELAAILGATLEARHRGVPVLLDGFVATAAVAPLFAVNAGALDHAVAAHVSAEAAHRRLLQALRLDPLLDLGMRLGEASGAALAIPILRAALACHTGMATFADAGVSDGTA